MWAKRAHSRDTRDSGDMKSEKALCKGLFIYTRPYSTVIMVGPITVVVTNRVVIGAVNIIGARVKHQRV